MRTTFTLLAVSLVTAGFGSGCGQPTCQTATCTTGTKTYQVCSKAGGTETYNFGGMSCDCGGTSSTNCQTCTTEVANYCTGGAGGAGGSGGGGSGGGSGGGGGGVTCTATFTGGFTSTYSPCAVTVTYNASSGTTIASAGNLLPGTSYTWSGFSLTLASMPAPGTFAQTSAVGSSTSVEETGSPSTPVWEAGYGMGNTYGTASVTVTSLGPSSNVNGTTLYQSAHGTFTATMVDQNPMTHMPDVMQTVTF